MKVWQHLLDELRTLESEAILVTLFNVTGSSPREQGTRMLVLADRTIGTIGGGMLEWDATNEARESMSKGNLPANWRSDKLLGPDLKQCCGGGVTLLFEYFSYDDFSDVQALAHAESSGTFTTQCSFNTAVKLSRKIARQRGKATLRNFTPLSTLEIHTPQSFSEHFENRKIPLVLFGAGHVGRALVKALILLPYEVTWVDSRADMFPTAGEENVTMVVSNTPQDALNRLSHDSRIVVMTHSHVVDFELVAAALKQPFPYVGLIGSKSKGARFRSRLKKWE